MARWRLLANHYLRVPGTEWEYKETDQLTGRQGRKVFEVPLYLLEGQVVAHEGSAQREDVIFLGPPTPDMEPLDDEAKEISTAMAPLWKHPIESLPGNYSASLISDFEKQMSEAASRPAVPAIDPAAFAKLQEQVATLTAELASKSANRRA